MPIVNNKRTDLQLLQKKGFTQNDLKKAYFNRDEKKEKSLFSYPVVVYKRDKNVCASRSFAENVTGSQTDVSGIFVSGDDRALSAALRQDVNGISYNNLGLVYNLQTRKVADGIAIVPIDLNENGTIDADENIYATLDDVLNYFSTTDNTVIPHDNVNVVFNKNTISKNSLDFINWIITTGQEYNRRYGFLNLDKSVAANESQVVNGLKKDKTK
ncbi:hypothetical protein [Segetibacter koreensis]|uniref:hypothetical protein n=1 Tax=Segetibacter koreensis TaxID=398037 RepID=UPI0003823733|nr:hypothetical protein [Segetibacter koreensis]